MNNLAASNADGAKMKKEILKKMKEGKKDRTITLPPEDFSYGLANPPSITVKDLITNTYGNEAEIEIKEDYKAFMEKMQVQSRSRLVPRKTNHYKKLIETRKSLEARKEEKPLYKLAMFKNVGSKVAEGIRSFKTYQHKDDAGLNNIINKVQEEIKANEELPQTATQQ